MGLPTERTWNTTLSPRYSRPNRGIMLYLARLIAAATSTYESILKKLQGAEASTASWATTVANYTTKQKVLDSDI